MYSFSYLNVLYLKKKKKNLENFDSSGHLELSVKAEWRKKALEKSVQPIIFMTEIQKFLVDNVYIQNRSWIFAIWEGSDQWFGLLEQSNFSRKNV